MTLCPVALAVGCRRCPIFAVCPAKSLIGDQPPAEAAADAKVAPAARRRRPSRRRRG